MGVRSLEHGADVNAKDESKKTALHYALEHKDNLEVIQLLINGGAVLQDHSILTTAVAHQPTEVLDLLKEAAGPIDTTDPEYVPPIITAAAENKEPSMLLSLIRSGADINASSNKHNGGTALHVALGGVNCDNFAIHSMLIGAGANLSAKNNYGQTPLHQACQNGAVETSNLMVDAGADVHRVDDFGNTPLTIACERGVSTEIILKLIKAGADPNHLEEDADGRTPLCCAIECNRYALHESSKSNVVASIKALLNAGADPNMKSANGLTPLFFAMISTMKCDSITQSLLEAGADPKLPFDAQKYELNFDLTVDLTSCRTPWQLARSICDTKSLEQFDKAGYQLTEEDLQIGVDVDARLAALLIGKAKIGYFTQCSISNDECSIVFDYPTTYSMGERVTYDSQEACTEALTNLSIGIHNLVQRLSSLEGWRLSQPRSETSRVDICVASRTVFDRMMISPTMSRVNKACKIIQDFESDRFKNHDEHADYFRKKLNQQTQKGEEASSFDRMESIIHSKGRYIRIGELFQERRSNWNDLVLTPDQEDLGLLPALNLLK